MIFFLVRLALPEQQQVRKFVTYEIMENKSCEETVLILEWTIVLQSRPPLLLIISAHNANILL